MPCVGGNVHAHTRTHTRIPLSRDALAERRDMSEVSSGLGQRKEGVLMLKLPQVFWLSCAWMERKSSWEAPRLTLYGNHTPAAVSRTLPLDLSWNRFTKQLLGCLSPLHFHLTDTQTFSLRCFAGPGVVSFQQEFFNPSYRLNIYFTLADETLAVGVCCVLPAGALQM